MEEILSLSALLPALSSCVSGLPSVPCKSKYNDFKSQYIVEFIRYKPTGQNYKLYIYASNLVHTNVTFWLPLYVQENSKLTDS